MVLMNLWDNVLELVTFSIFNSVYIKKMTLYIMHMLVYCLQVIYMRDQCFLAPAAMSSPKPEY